MVYKDSLGERIEMKIGFDARMIDWAGVGTYSYNLLKALQEIDKTNEYILFCDRQSIVQVPDGANSRKAIVTEAVFSAFLQLFFSLTLKNQKLDIFHSPHFIYPLFLSSPAVVTIHDLIPLKCPPSMPSIIGRAYYQKANRRAIAKAKMVVVVSESTKKDIQEIFDVTEERIRVIPHGVGNNFQVVRDKSLLDEVKRKYRIRSKFILNIGNSKPHKNWAGLIESFALLRKETKDYQLVLVGGRDSRFSEAVKLIKKLELEEDVLITGFVAEKDMPLLYNAAEILVFPSHYEGFGLPVLEAMACGTPVICSNSSSLPEVAGDAALMVDPNDGEGLAASMKKVLAEQRIRQDLSEKGLKRIEQFSWKKAAQRTLEVYGEVTQNH